MPLIILRMSNHWILIYWLSSIISSLKSQAFVGLNFELYCGCILMRNSTIQQNSCLMLSDFNSSWSRISYISHSLFLLQISSRDNDDITNCVIDLQTFLLLFCGMICKIYILFSLLFLCSLGCLYICFLGLVNSEIYITSQFCQFFFLLCPFFSLCLSFS